MPFLDSNTVYVYPSVRRKSRYYTDSRLISEKNLTSIISKLIDTEGYVISDIFDENNIFEFNVYGYYFYVSKGSYITSQFSNAAAGTQIYANIKIDEGTSNSLDELIGQDVAVTSSISRYEGVEFTTSPRTSRGYHSLPLLQKTSTGWEIVPSSKYKFDTTSFFPDIIDGGEIYNI